MRWTSGRCGISGSITLGMWCNGVFRWRSKSTQNSEEPAKLPVVGNSVRTSRHYWYLNAIQLMCFKILYLWLVLLMWYQLSSCPWRSHNIIPRGGSTHQQPTIYGGGPERNSIKSPKCCDCEDPLILESSCWLSVMGATRTIYPMFACRDWEALGNQSGHWIRI